MNGLEGIFKKISEDNDTEVKKIVACGNKAVEEYLKSETVLTEKLAAEITDTAKKHAAQTLSTAESGYDSIVKRLELSIKAEIINAWIDDTLNKAKKADSETYFAVIEKLLIRYHHIGEGVVRFSGNDTMRIPKGFIENVNKKLKDGSVSLGEKTDIDCGCILVYGEIEENCTFEALLKDKSDEIKDCLFALINGVTV